LIKWTGKEEEEGADTANAAAKKQFFRDFCIGTSAKSTVD
jgi:hypothetical protein